MLRRILLGERFNLIFKILSYSGGKQRERMVSKPNLKNYGSKISQTDERHQPRDLILPPNSQDNTTKAIIIQFTVKVLKSKTNISEKLGIPTH